MRKVAKKAVKKVVEESWTPATQDPVEPGVSVVQFKKDGAKRSRLIGILRDPVFREAVEIIKDELEPRGDLPIFYKPKIAAARYHELAGMKYLTDGLRRLTKEHQETKPLKGRSLSTAADLVARDQQSSH